MLRHMAKESSPSNYELSPLANVLARRLVQRWDCYPQQTDDGTAFYTRHEPLNIEQLFAHLRGEITLGTYLLNQHSQGRFLVLDADTTSQWHDLTQLSDQLAQKAIPTYLEHSRRGGHMWCFFDQWLPGKQIRQFAHGLLAVYAIKAMEIYPKQDTLDQGPGSLVRLPFGVHRKTGHRYGFVQPDGTPLAPTITEQVRLFSQRQTVPKTALAEFIDHWVEMEAKRQKTAVTGSLRASPMTDRDGPLSERIKAAMSVHQFVGQFVELSPSGQGLCPFHDDHHPSFSVNEAANYWYCFACDKGGSIIDFWMVWQQCDFVTAVHQLAGLLGCL